MAGIEMRTKKAVRKRRPLSPEQKYRRARTVASKFLHSLPDDEFESFVANVRMSRTTRAVYLPAIIDEINKAPRLLRMFGGK